MLLVGCKGTFRDYQEHMLLELRAHQKYVLLERRAQQKAHIESKVVVLAKLNYFIYSIIYAIFYHHLEDIFFMSQYL